MENNLILDRQNIDRKQEIIEKMSKQKKMLRDINSDLFYFSFFNICFVPTAIIFPTIVSHVESSAAMYTYAAIFAGACVIETGIVKHFGFPISRIKKRNAIKREINRLKKQKEECNVKLNTNEKCNSKLIENEPIINMEKTSSVECSNITYPMVDNSSISFPSNMYPKVKCKRKH